MEIFVALFLFAILLWMTSKIIQLTKRLKDAQARLRGQDKLASLGMLSAGIVHEIKNPLNFMINFSSLSLDLMNEMKEPVESQNTLKENLTQIVEQGKKANHIIEKILIQARLENDQKTPTDLNSLILEYLNLAYYALIPNESNSPISIEKILDSSIEKIDMNGEEIGRVLLNLFNNSFYSMIQKKRSLLDYQPHLLVITKNLDKEIEIKICDNGLGIPKSITHRIFTPFFTTKPPGEGTGLGLILCRDIICIKHKGSLDFHSVEGEFTEFILRLPK